MPPFEHMTVPQAREAAWAFVDLQGPAPEVASVQHQFIPGPTADLPLQIYTPRRRPVPRDRVLPRGRLGHPQHRNLRPDDARTRQRHRVRRGGGELPEGPGVQVPIPFNDAWASTWWVAAHAEELGADPSRIAVGGDSAGGNLAAAVTIRARQEGGPALAYQLLVYPAIEHDIDKPSAIRNAEGLQLHRESMRWFWSHYLDGATDEPDWRTSPLRARTLADLPPHGRQLLWAVARRSSSPLSSTPCATTGGCTLNGSQRTGSRSPTAVTRA